MTATVCWAFGIAITLTVVAVAGFAWLFFNLFRNGVEL